MINSPPFMNLNIRIPIIASIKGRGSLIRGLHYSRRHVGEENSEFKLPHGLLFKLLVCHFITPILALYTIPYIAPLKKFTL